jgi:hypothetical protein
VKREVSIADINLAFQNAAKVNSTEYLPILKTDRFCRHTRQPELVSLWCDFGYRENESGGVRQWNRVLFANYWFDKRFW